jgi:hypothetical protein
MPVLDAKALELDPKGAAFLMGVLRSQPALKPAPKAISRVGRLLDHARMAEFRLAKRQKDLLTDPV